MKFQVNQQVQVTGNHPSNIHRPGAITIIEKINSGMYKLKGDDKNLYHESELTEITHIRVGTIVEVIDNKTRKGRRKHLAIGTIAKVREVGQKPGYFWLEGDNGFPYRTAQLKLASNIHTTGEAVSKVNLNKIAFDALNLQVGDKVNVCILINTKQDLKHFGVNTSRFSWIPKLSNYLNKEGVVIQVSTETYCAAIQFENGEVCGYPAICLELVSRKPKEVTVALNARYNAIISEKGVTVDNNTYSFATIENLSNVVETKKVERLVTIGGYSAKINVSEVTIEIGCQIFTDKTLDRLLKGIKEFKGSS